MHPVSMLLREDRVEGVETGWKLGGELISKVEVAEGWPVRSHC